MFSKDALEMASAFKKLARDEEKKASVLQSDEWYSLLLKVAKRFVAGDTKEEAIQQAMELLKKGYDISLEYIGENIRDEKMSIDAKDECIACIQAIGRKARGATLSLDLSHIGLLVNRQLTLKHMRELLNEAKRYDHMIMISMEEATKTDVILDVYKELVVEYQNIGITVQAQLHRSEADIKELIHYPGKIRIVKGAYQEDEGISLPRSKELDDRYIQLVKVITNVYHPISIATHDEKLIKRLFNQGILHQKGVECEMLYGIQPNLLKELKSQGVATKVYIVYGTEWYLYLCHRIAEYPPNIYRAVTSMLDSASNRRNPIK
ncbi:proline dehydrogenase family protein [Alkalihalobacillus hemicellulosilyticus]|uniref:proline dehydrogenase n=1 Tax=Halalkalibacter hemicellulosilyticusJCM 9152 TaxID=1236971 RepID=W4Q9U9_9BACI|nr:proline dehydrogenase family protein [Halalkalibacter hemicellulosilyticus]GAE28785.1 proline dehydrogenase [Halalkalibacter hemicellulosilyticusJCM 9152]